MKLLDNVKYDKLTYQNYLTRLKAILNNEKLKEYGLKYEIKGYTEYNYPFETITIGKGNKDIFIVGGTHGSEVIGVDFVLQLMENIPNFAEFDPNLYKIVFIPLQNPEGFEVSTSTFKTIDDSVFQEKSFEYYQRYRNDSLIALVMKSLNDFVKKLLDSNLVLTPNEFVNNLKSFVNSDKNWLKLGENKALPQLADFIKAINELADVTSFNDLKNKLLSICDYVENNLDKSDYRTAYFKLFLNEFRQGFENTLIWQEIDKSNKIKLHQQMFANDKFENIDNEALKNQVQSFYEKYNYPKGSQIAYDANGSGINLNTNSKTNPGVESLRNNSDKVYAAGPRNNVVKFFKGPIGAPTKDINNFTYEPENIYLERMLKDSYEQGRYLSTFLYHGTGGMIFYKPYEPLMAPEAYQKFLADNKILADIYNQQTNYRLIDSADLSGYGDYLRRTYPNVLLIELSKDMGGNPLGPYGTEDNIYQTININLNAIRSVLNYYNILLTKKNKML